METNVLRKHIDYLIRRYRDEVAGSGESCKNMSIQDVEMGLPTGEDADIIGKLVRGY